MSAIAAMRDRMMEFEEFNRLIGADRRYADDERFRPRRGKRAHGRRDPD